MASGDRQIWPVECAQSKLANLQYASSVLPIVDIDDFFSPTTVSLLDHIGIRRYCRWFPRAHFHCISRLLSRFLLTFAPSQLPSRLSDRHFDLHCIRRLAPRS